MFDKSKASKDEQENNNKNTSKSSGKVLCIISVFFKKVEHITAK